MSTNDIDDITQKIVVSELAPALSLLAGETQMAKWSAEAEEGT